MIQKKPKGKAPQTLSEVFGFTTESKPSYKIGDLFDLKDDWGPGMVYECLLDKEADEWKYRVSFPKKKKERWFYEKKIRYFAHSDQIKVFRS